MKRATIEDLELGNLIFGNSRGNYVINRDIWQSIFEQLYDICEDDFENETFILRPYYWGDDEAEKEKPNFVYKPTGFNISWYKYPMRDAYASDDITDETFIAIVKDCVSSLSLPYIEEGKEE